MSLNRINIKLKRYQEEFLLRKQRNTVSDKLINFCNNNYLGLAAHPKVKKAFIQGINKYGVGSASSPSISGYFKVTRQLEEKFAEVLNREQAILFNSGYHANLGIISVLANRDSTIVSDKMCHASILDGIKLSRAKHYRYKHQCIEHADSQLAKAGDGALLVTEGIFSMQGDITPLHDITSIASKHNAILVVDDAHGIGVLGRTGGGICEHYGLTQNDVPGLIVPMGKAIGTMGAIVSGSNSLIEGLRQFSRTYIYSTALPPAIACATLAALIIMEQEEERRLKLQSLIQYFIKQSNLLGLSLVSEHLTPIKSIITCDNKKTLEIQSKLMQQGFFVGCIRPPTVPANTARIKISLNCTHKESDIKNLLHLLAYEIQNSK